jgi:hypothetical protein
MTDEATWTNEHGELLRLVWEDDRPVLYHSDYDNVPVVIELRVIGIERDRPLDDSGLVTSELIQRRAMGDIVLDQQEQNWLLSRIARHAAETR